VGSGDETDFAFFRGLLLERGAIIFLLLTVNKVADASGPQRRKASEQTPERDERGVKHELRDGILTSDLRGGCGPKLTDGFQKTPLAGRGTCLASATATKRPTTPDDQQSFLNHCATSKVAGGLTSKHSIDRRGHRGWSADAMMG
jgi:hypothetical protein